MAIARIVSQTVTALGGTGATATYPALPQKGNLLIAVATNNVGSTSSMLSGANQFILAITVPDTSATSSTSIWYRIAAGNETTITSNKVTASTSFISIHEYAGFNATPYLDQKISATSSALTIPTGTTALTTTADELVIAAAGIAANNTLTSWSNSFVGITAQSNVVSLFVAELIATAKGAFTTTATTTPTSGLNEGIIATFRSLPQQLNNYQQLKVGDGMSTSEKIR